MVVVVMVVTMVYLVIIYYRDMSHSSEACQPETHRTITHPEFPVRYLQISIQLSSDVCNRFAWVSNGD